MQQAKPGRRDLDVIEAAVKYAHRLYPFRLNGKIDQPWKQVTNSV
ncbi:MULTISPECIES: hypothetical protein [Xanthomonas]|uniref:Uncharacterized protein n=1 Tax=Xanthomonas sacchari TaxID=56458 RepID=A0ABT3DRB3_9XANT|nr:MULTISPECIES: hypothetical protein [Xanthomonas]MCW0370505.1 hypothetical protein [Xanthomonas sacchari]MCW0379178.1 hypothetical protein [Xanthomonas sacchari]MCW0398030.1 hypothetical protein [Xanthomonas sacchari]MCW0403479.1 hypothetical protein [Xanthomonas sacchari]MCW0412648.1 hypothetical protein [Xanthomonas sacchari]